MKKSSFFLSTSIMTLALIVAIVGVTAAWFGDVSEYSDTIDVSSKNPENNALIDPESTSPLPQGDKAKLAPAVLKAGYGLGNAGGSGGYDDIKIGPHNEYGGIDDLKDVIAKPATTVTVTFDFVYTGAAANEDEKTTRLRIELVSVTLKNPLLTLDEYKQLFDENADEDDLEAYLSDIINYRDEFGVNMSVYTNKAGVLTILDGNGATYYHDGKEITVKDKNGNDVKKTVYELKGAYYYPETMDGDILLKKTADGAVIIPEGKTINPYVIHFDIVPVTHALSADIYFCKVDEATAPELVGAQLFLNFKVSFLEPKGGDTNENGGNQ